MGRSTTSRRPRDQRERRRFPIHHPDPPACAIGIDEWLEQIHSDDWEVRRRVVGEACPCHIKANYPALWDRVLEMVADPDARVRANVLHMLCDGSPREREAEVVAAIEAMRNDPDPKLRRHVRHTLATYRRRGKINIL